jgi:hypothetical protein
MITGSAFIAQCTVLLFANTAADRTTESNCSTNRGAVFSASIGPECN